MYEKIYENEEIKWNVTLLNFKLYLNRTSIRVLKYSPGQTTLTFEVK